MNQNIIEIIKNSIKIREEEMNERKRTISASYYMAKHDFRVIENYEDEIETLKYMLEKYEDCRERIIERNKINIDDL